ncbi:MAG: 3-methyl-2-oxobutanoate hydroxymethyltransferase [Clostridiales bacterium]|jgi:3-methyl-2-oxobutanoate hydroxymethyltransferase|nr:3-methyl-2-oxobutanoate hydroxymethyltransferase [Clostridiales bacterium]
MAKITTLKLQEMKEKGEKISMTTAYDYPTALLAEKAGIEIILVGDSLMMAVLGDDSTVSCTIDQMIYHIKPVVLGAPTPLIVGDLPFGSYNESKEQAVRNATRLMKEGRCDVIKLEGGKEIADTVKAIVDAGVPVMGHIGLTPQTVSKLGGFRVQGKGDKAKEVLEDALAIQEAGAFSIVLECIPDQLGKLITEKLTIPTIGIGGGRYTDGQVLVFHDMVGLFDKFVPKFVKQYLNLTPEIVKALETFKEEVKSGKFPEEKHTFGGVTEEELERLY